MGANVLTLIAAPSATGAVEAATATVAEALERLGAHLAGGEWLAPGIARDILFEDLDPDQADAAARKALAQTLGPVAIDLVSQAVERRRKRLLLADMESTVIANEMLDELADLYGLREEVAEITRRAMNDEIDFAAALKERVALLRGLPESALGEAAGRIRITPGARELVATMRAQGAFTALISGGFRIYTSLVRAELGFDLDIGNDIIVADGRLSGRVKEPILARDAKLAVLKRVAAERELPLIATLAVGDGANDIAMIEAAGLGIAFHAQPAVAARARGRIEHNDLKALLYLQGYRAEEVVSVENPLGCESSSPMDD
jgi:phosphoserine phosphatase